MSYLARGPEGFILGIDSKANAAGRRRSMNDRAQNVEEPDSMRNRINFEEASA